LGCSKLACFCACGEHLCFSIYLHGNRLRIQKNSTDASGETDMTLSKKALPLCVFILGTLLAISTVAPVAFSGNLVSASTTVFQDGFESGNLSAWVSDGSLSVVASPVYSGSFAGSAVGPSVWVKTLSSGYSDLYLSVEVYIPTMIQNGQQTAFLAIQDAAYSNIVAGGLLSYNGNTYWTLRVNNDWYPTQATIKAGQWYSMQIEYSTAGIAKLWVDGNLVNSVSGQSLKGAAQIIQGGNPFGATPSNFVSYGDDYCIATSYISPETSAPTTTPTTTPTQPPAQTVSAFFANGFEASTSGAWVSDGSLSVVASPVYSGSFAGSAVGPSVWVKTLSSGYSDLFFAGYVQIPSMLQSGQATSFLAIQDASYSNIVAGGLQVDDNGNSYWVLRVNNDYCYASSTMQPGQWYFMEIEYNTAGVANLWVDNSLVYSVSCQPLKAAQIVQAGNPAGYTPSSFVSYGDDYVVASSFITAGGVISQPSDPEPTTTPTPTQTPTPTSTATPTPTTTPTPTSTPTPTPTSTAPATNGLSWLHTSGANIYDSSGKQVKLYTCNIQQGDGSVVTQSDIQKIKSMGFNCIRVWVLWGEVQPSPTSVNTAYFTSGAGSSIGVGLDSIVNWAAQAGLYVIICPGWGSWHPLPSWVVSGDISVPDGGTSMSITSSTNIAGLSYLYNWMGSHYATNSNVIFESLNELSTSNNAEAGQPFADFNNAWVSAIEQGEGSNSHLKIIEYLVNYNSAYGALLTAPFISGSHSNIIMATHDYGLVKDPNNASYDSLVQMYADAAHNAGMPWMDTEFGTALGGDSSDVNTALSLMTNHNAAGWAWYCYCPIAGNEGSWNLNNPSVASQLLPILQSYMK
jgi:hypothetical protein